MQRFPLHNTLSKIWWPSNALEVCVYVRTITFEEVIFDEQMLDFFRVSSWPLVRRRRLP